MAALQLRQALKQQLGEVAYRRLKPAHIQTLWKQQIRSADDLRGAVRWGVLQSVKLPPDVVKLLLEHFGGATTRRYIVEYQSTQKVLTLSSHVTLIELKHAVERKFAMFRHVEYDLQLQGGEAVSKRAHGLILLSQEGWARLMDVLPASSDVHLRLKPLGKPYSEYIGANFGDLSWLAQDYLGVRDLEASFFDPGSFQGMDISSSVLFDGMNLDEIVDHTALTLKRANITTRDTQSWNLVAPVLADAVLISQKLGPEGNELNLIPQYDLPGRRAWGAVDYALTYKIPAIIVTQTKLYNTGEVWGQVLMQLASTRDLLVRRLCDPDSRRLKHWEVPELANIPTCGVLCSNTSYRLWRYLPNLPPAWERQEHLDSASQRYSLEVSKEFEINLDRLGHWKEEHFKQLKAELSQLLKALVHLIVDQMRVISEAQDKLPSLNRQYHGGTSDASSADGHASGED